MNWGLTAFIVLTFYNFKDYFSVWGDTRDTLYMLVYHIILVYKEVWLQITAVDFTVANFNSKLVKPSLVMKD